MTDHVQGIVVRPTVKLEDVREDYWGNECVGRGRETAAARGYNAELLPNALLGKRRDFHSWSPGPWVDNYVPHPSGIACYVEVKIAIKRYPSGGFGRFRIWGSHHHRLVAAAEVYEQSKRLYIYLFIVYTVESGVEREIGKVIVPAEEVDDHLGYGNRVDHVSMGDDRTHSISWKKLIDALGVSAEEFTSKETVDLTVESEPLQRARAHLDS
jgi:hypothetical protein